MPCREGTAQAVGYLLAVNAPQSAGHALPRGDGAGAGRGAYSSSEPSLERSRSTALV